MFTGIIEAVGRIGRITRVENGARMEILSQLGSELSHGESVAVNGVCLTVADKWDEGFVVDVMPETLRRSNLGDLRPGAAVNLERAIAIGGRLGGHIVLGHVDGVGVVLRKVREGTAYVVTIRPPQELLRYVVEKGSIAVDGVSLTVARIERDCFAVSLVSYTLEHTILGSYEVGTRVNLECDILGKYVERFLGQFLSAGECEALWRKRGARSFKGVSNMEKVLQIEEELASGEAGALGGGVQSGS